MISISNRVKSILGNKGLYDIFQKASELEAKGHKMIHMEIGKPDFDSPEKAKDAAIEALQAGKVHYTPMIGVPELRNALKKKQLRVNNMEIDAENEIVVTAGGCEALSTIFFTMFEPGDEIIIPTPAFSAYFEIASIAGVKVVEVPLSIEDGFQINTLKLRQALTSKTKAILVNSPSNPTGVTCDVQTLHSICELAIEIGLLIISDETYDEFYFGEKPISIATLPNMKERTIVCNSASKTFSMTGWRIGYIIAKNEWSRALAKVHQNLSTCATSFAQYGAAEAYNTQSAFTQEMVDTFRDRRDILIKGLQEIPGIDFVVPSGAFYLFANIKGLGIDGQTFCEEMLNYGVALSPGSAFGKDFTDYIRLAFACSTEDLKEAIIKIKQYALSRN